VARSLFERSLALSQQLSDRRSMAESLHGLGVVAELEGDYPRASSLFQQSVPIAREVGAKRLARPSAPRGRPSMIAT
jgi:hypothetical protein